VSPLQFVEGVEDAAECVGSVAMSHGRFVIDEKQCRDGQPVRAISYLEPEADWDSGFALFRSEPDQVGENVELVCFDCLLDDEPGIAKGLELARQHGEAICEGDEWSVRSIVLIAARPVTF
jgi:hypothetical protein